MELWTAFALGLVGSLHCAGMCGPLALALPHAGNRPASYFVGRAAYNLGRVVTYCVSDSIFGLLGKTLLLAGVQRWLSMALGVVLLVGLFASRKLALWRPVTRTRRTSQVPGWPRCCADDLSTLCWCWGF